MCEKTKQAVRVVEAALLLGVLGDGLLRATPWGLNILIWTGALIIALFVLLPCKRRQSLAGAGHWPLISSILFAAAFAWRDSLTLNFLAGLGMLLSLTLAAWRARAGRIWLAGINEYVMGILVAGMNAFFAGFPLLLCDVQWNEIAGAGRSGRVKATLRGLVIAVPLLLLFGALFMSADARFEGMVNRVFSLNFDDAFGHFLLASLLSWIAGGYLRGLLFGREVKIVDGRATLVSATPSENTALGIISLSNAPQTLKPKPISLGIVEISITLGLLNLLFLAFVLLQLRYFFGGVSLVQASDGLTFSGYYRRGFFELVVVAALVLPLLLTAHWLLRKENPAHERIFRLFAGTQVALLFIIMTSAVRRMLLYQNEYGLTELRLYTTAFMAWLALVFVWFVATALRGRREQFACGALLAGLLVIATLHVMNPDAFIVRVNVAHAQMGRGFDADYAASLSADATPALLESLSALSVDCQRIIARKILRRWSHS
ncbi:MAG TPA: DUF4173 domain-containing protein, partial [Pyrinomonadaceae bacterium]|nr:DUF4173 domain-containing protein [Pyrinomonadaceae bacterium]